MLRKFGEEALQFFSDLTTDAKLNPRPKQDEIVLAFKPDFEALLAQNTSLAGAKRQELTALFHRIQKSRSNTEAAHTQKNAFQRLSFLLELLNYYENQATEAPDVIFALRLPVLIEQLALAPGQETLNAKWIAQAASTLASSSSLGATKRPSGCSGTASGSPAYRTLSPDGCRKSATARPL